MPEEGFAVFVTLAAPLASVNVTVSVESQPDARAIETETDETFPRLTYEPPEPPPFVKVTELGFAGGVASATAVVVGLSKLSSAGVALEIARITYVYDVPSTVVVSLYANVDSGVAFSFAYAPPPLER